MKSRASFAAFVLCVALTARAAGDDLDEVVISASLRPVSAAQLAASVTVLDSATVRTAGVQHFGDLLGLVPNLTAAGGTSRPRYFQIRGVGEQEQYQGAPNPSVGFLIDGIDFSGVGMPATLFDVRRIEVLRGPQAATYGANALAGLINVETEAADGAAPGSRAELTAGDYDTRAAGAAFGGGGHVGDGALGWRLAAQQYKSNGFRRNAFLGREDTNGLDEQTLRGKLRWQPANGDWTADLTLMHVDLDNGYDAWSIDNSRVTESDQPGRDSQRSNGGALKLRHTAGSFGDFQSLSSVADSHIVFSFDGDWGNNAFWAAQSACRPDPSLCVPYDFTSRTFRHRQTVAQDLRWLGDAAHRVVGAQWLLGAYAQRLREDNDQLDLYNGDVYRQLTSHYAATQLAVYGQLDWLLGAHARFTVGLRGEQRRADYDDSDGSRFAPTDRMLGGNLTLQYTHSDTHTSYATLARGYKAGGFNIGASVPAERRQFRPEYLWNLELGTRGHQGTLRWQTDVFYMRRVDQQVSTSVQTDPNDPLTYQFYTDNAAKGYNAGAEAELQWQLAPRWLAEGTLALLRARYLDFGYPVVSYDLNGVPQVVQRDLGGRAQEYAPAGQISMALGYRAAAGWFARLDAQYTASYYFSASHDQQAPARTLVNLRAGINHGRWEASAWTRNLFDVSYALHGFYFGNEPPDFANKLYLSAGEPRQVGITVRYQVAP
jgi:iron complex outermembrane recepter protein